MSEALPRWKVFPREIESDLHLYHGIDIGDWHEGRLSSRKLLAYLDGLPNESWYKLSVQEFINEIHEESERAQIREPRSFLLAQLYGQSFEAADTTE